MRMRSSGLVLFGVAGADGVFRPTWQRHASCNPPTRRFGERGSMCGVAVSLDLDTAWELNGAWWLPGPELSETDQASTPQVTARWERPEFSGSSRWPAYGALRYTPSEGLRLRTLGPSGNPFLTSAKNLLIWGQASGGRPWTLVDAFEENSRTQLPHGLVAEQTIYANAAVANAHVRTLDDLVFSQAWLKIIGLHELLWHEGRGKDQLATDTAEDAHPGDLAKVIQIPGATLTFHLAWEGSDGTHRKLRERNAYVQIQLEHATSYSAWMERWVTPVLNLVTFATREPARLVSLKAVLYDERNEQAERFLQVKDSKAFRRRDVHIILPQTDLVRTKPRFRYNRILVGLAELGEDADRFVGRWMEMHAELATGRDIFFVALTSRLYIENEVLSLMSAAEAYHRTFHDEVPLSQDRHATLMAAMLDLLASKQEQAVYKGPLEHANQQSQRVRLRWLFSRVSKLIPELRPTTNADIDALVETRNFYTHLGARSDKVLDGMTLKHLLDRLVLVLNANYLLDLGMPHDDAERCIRRSYAGWQQEILGATEPGAIDAQNR